MHRATDIQTNIQSEAALYYPFHEISVGSAVQIIRSKIFDIISLRAVQSIISFVENLHTGKNKDISRDHKMRVGANEALKICVMNQAK
jgi:hypothetical protein